jgi:phosphoserine aminotransferase
MQGGGVAENAIVPLNLLRGFTRAAFVDTGIWAGKTILEFGKYGTAHVAASAGQAWEIDGRVYQPYAYIPPENAWDVPADAAYLHVCLNETIGGVAFAEPPARGFGVPLVADVSSMILSRPLDVSRFGLLYGGAQKNIGPAGLTLVIVHDGLLDRALDVCPSAFHYRTVAANGSMYNTPPTYAIYIAGLVFQWLKRQGGLVAIRAANQAKARLLYDTLDASGFYANPIVPADRSTMNVPFRLRDESLNALFLERAQQRGLYQLKGHKSVGGMRASIYNAMPLAGVQALTEHLRDFEKEFG